MGLIAGLFLTLILPFLEGPEKKTGFALLLFFAFITGYRLLKLNLIFDAIDFLFAFFLLFASISTIFSLSLSRSFVQWLVYLAVFIIFLSLRRLDKSESQKIKSIFTYGITVVSIILSLISLSFFLPIKVFPLPRSGMNLYFPTFGHNHLAGVLLIAIPLILSRYADSKNENNIKSVKIWAFTALFLLVSLAFTFSRSAYVLILFCISVFVFSGKFDPKNKFFGGIATISIIIFFIFQFIFFNSLFGHKLQGFPKQLYKQVSSPDLRFYYLNQAWRGFEASPVFGTGLDTFRYVSALYQTKSLTSSDYTHNQFVEMFTETGINGGIMFLFLISLVLFRIYKEKKYSAGNFGLGLTLAITISTVNNFIDYDWQLLSLFLFFWICIALLLPIDAGRVNLKMKKSNILFIPFLILFVSFSATLILGRTFLYFSQRNGKYHPQAWSFASYLVPWQGSFQESLAQLAAENKKSQLVRYYNNRAQRLDKNETSFYTFRAYFEDGLGNYDSALQNHLMAIWTNPLDTKDSYKSIYRYMIINVIYTIKKHQLIQAYNSLVGIINIFPSISRQASLGLDLESVLSYLNKGDDKSASGKLYEIAQKGLDSVPWVDMNDQDIKYAYDKLFPVIDNNR
ncbi:O-antigen ligase family protein [Patescibacteria group bacterium]|nr:O-antigen ligase family protein [Patescibacteria group bacterium]